MADQQHCPTGVVQPGQDLKMLGRAGQVQAVQFDDAAPIAGRARRPPGGLAGAASGRRNDQIKPNSLPADLLPGLLGLPGAALFEATREIVLGAIRPSLAVAEDEQGFHAIAVRQI